ncbi:MAG: hypothetical protein HYS78_02355 [Parcubacteria group bacterium]|nr:hypothetical protein [Parcubacteria group bacterium]
MPVTLEEAQIYDPYEAYMRQVIGDSFKYNQLHNKLDALSDNLLDFVFSPEPAEFIKNRVAIPFSLSENQSKETAKIVMDLILADLYLGNIVDEIQNRLKKDEAEAKIIAGLIVTKLFAPILEDLKKIHVEKFAKNLPPQQPQNQSNQIFDDRVVDLKNNM